VEILVIMAMVIPERVEMIVAAMLVIWIAEMVVETNQSRDRIQDQNQTQIPILTLDL
jgi:hypothetical protein